MKHTTITVAEHSSGRPEFSSLMVSVRQTLRGQCNVAIGYPGLPNIVQEMKNGDAVLFETSEDGILEIRAISLQTTKAEFLITQVAPTFGFAASLFVGDKNNTPFTEQELSRIADSISELKEEIKRSAHLTQAQIALVNDKLNEFQDASVCLNRKDWIIFVASSVTAFCISAAFAPEAATSMFQSLNFAFAWLFPNGTLMLQPPINC